jgi:hypothetical protein
MSCQRGMSYQTVLTPAEENTGSVYLYDKALGRAHLI